MRRMWTWFTPTYSVFGLIKVSGDSMVPALYDGDIIITKKPRSLRPGLIYVIDHSDLGVIIKRLGRIDARGLAVLAGDNPASTPPALMGAVEPTRIRARAWLSLSKRGLAWL